MARRFVTAHRSYVEWTQEAYQLTPTEAWQRVSECNALYLDSVRTGPPDQVSWQGLHSLEEAEEGAGFARWREIRHAAREELASGQRTAEAVCGKVGDPWKRAQFLALRDEYLADWQPRGGIEQTLVEKLAVCMTEFIWWTTAVTNWHDWEHETWAGEKGKEGLPPRITYVEAADRAFEMADRWNRIYLRTLRAMRDLRRYPVVIQNGAGGQVNIGQQQVNLAPSADEAVEKVYGKNAS